MVRKIYPFLPISLSLLFLITAYIKEKGEGFILPFFLLELISVFV